MTDPTPGPWRVAPRSGGVVEADRGKWTVMGTEIDKTVPVLQVFYVDPDTGGEEVFEANVRLAVDARRLLEAAEAAWYLLGEDSDDVTAELGMVLDRIRGRVG